MNLPSGAIQTDLLTTSFGELARLGILLALASIAQAKPLKVYIVAGQSNMEGHVQTRTFPAIAKDPATKYLYDKISH